MTEVDFFIILSDILVDIVGGIMFFGKIKGTDDEWGFDVFTSLFTTYKEINDDVHMSIINKANRDGKLIKGDIDGNPVLINPPPPTKEEVTKQRISELETYLSETDWFAIRYADTGEVIPSEIKQKRQDARNEISILREQLE